MGDSAIPIISSKDSDPITPSSFLDASLKYCCNSRAVCSFLSFKHHPYIFSLSTFVFDIDFRCVSSFLSSTIYPNPSSFRVDTNDGKSTLLYCLLRYMFFMVVKIAEFDSSLKESEFIISATS